jgi:hypothetical protein
MRALQCVVKSDVNSLEHGVWRVVEQSKNGALGGVLLLGMHIDSMPLMHTPYFSGTPFGY